MRNCDCCRSSRIVVLSSTAHYNGRIDFDDLQSRRSYKPWREYSQSKLANILFAYELARRLPLSTRCTRALWEQSSAGAVIV